MVETKRVATPLLHYFLIIRHTAVHGETCIHTCSSIHECTHWIVCTGPSSRLLHARSYMLSQQSSSSIGAWLLLRITALVTDRGFTQKKVFLLRMHKPAIRVCTARNAGVCIPKQEAHTHKHARTHARKHIRMHGHARAHTYTSKRTHVLARARMEPSSEVMHICV